MLQTSTVDRPVGYPLSVAKNPVGCAHPTATRQPPNSPTADNTLPKPTYQAGDFVQTEALKPGTEDRDRPVWILQTAQVYGLTWNPRHKEWEYQLYFPKRPCPWLNDGYFDPCSVIESAIYPLNYRLAA